MNVYLVYTANGEYEDYTEILEGVFSSLDRAKQWFFDHNYTENETPNYNGCPAFSYTYENYGIEPLRENYSNEEDWVLDHKDWVNRVTNHQPYWVEDYWGWIDTRKVL